MFLIAGWITSETAKVSDFEWVSIKRKKINQDKGKAIKINSKCIEDNCQSGFENNSEWRNPNWNWGLYILWIGCGNFSKYERVD